MQETRSCSILALYLTNIFTSLSVYKLEQAVLFCVKEEIQIYSSFNIFLFVYLFIFC